MRFKFFNEERNKHSTEANQKANDEADKDEETIDKIVANDGGPTACLEQRHDAFACVEVVITIQSNINKSPFVEVLRNALNVEKDTVSNATTNPTTPVVLGGAAHISANNLNDSHDETTKANGSKAVRCRP